jgi:hypothetical protein
VKIKKTSNGNYKSLVKPHNELLLYEIHLRKKGVGVKAPKVEASTKMHPPFNPVVLPK